MMKVIPTIPVGHQDIGAFFPPDFQVLVGVNLFTQTKID
jgi:hypothetical protein